VVDSPDGRIAVRGLEQYPLPNVCASRALLGLKCPTCGLTRSILHLVRGHWGQSWREHRLGVVVVAVIAAQIPYRLWALRQPRRPRAQPLWVAVLGLAFIVLLLGNWLAEVVAGRAVSL
jgi:hypothetical protein